MVAQSGVEFGVAGAWRNRKGVANGGEWGDEGVHDCVVLAAK